MTDVVLRYARLAVARDLFAARGERLPAALINEIQQIETAARARLTPAQLESAMNHVEHAKLRLQSEMAERSAAEQAATSRAFGDRITRELTRDVARQSNGLTRDQLDKVARGESLPTPKKPSQAQRDAIFRERTKNYDPTGKGWTEAEYARRLDELVEADPKQFEKLAEYYRADPQTLRALAKHWKTEGIEHELSRRRAARDSEPEVRDGPPTDSDRRRAALVSAYLESRSDDAEKEVRRGEQSEALRELKDEVHPEIYNETEPDGSLSRRANVARAMAEVESRGDSDGR